MKELVRYLLENMYLDFQGEISLDTVRQFLRTDDSREARQLLQKLIEDKGVDELLLTLADVLKDHLRTRRERRGGPRAAAALLRELSALAPALTPVAAAPRRSPPAATRGRRATCRARAARGSTSSGRTCPPRSRSRWARPSSSRSTGCSIPSRSRGRRSSCRTSSATSSRRRRRTIRCRASSASACTDSPDLLPDQTYQLAILPPQSATDSAGFRAIDGAGARSSSGPPLIQFSVVAGPAYAGPDACTGAPTSTSARR